MIDDLSAIISALEQVVTAPNRLVLLVGPPGSGKTGSLIAIQKEHGYPRVALGPPVAEELRSVPPKRRPAQVREIITRLLDDAGSPKAVLVDNIEVLFLPELETDPLGLFKDLSRNRTLCVSWPGVLEEDGTLRYAELGHPEHRTYRKTGISCVRMPGTV